MTVRTPWLRGAALTVALLLLVLPGVAQSVATPDVKMAPVKSKWARAQASVDPAGADVTWWFEYGETTGYGQATAAETASGSGPIPVRALLTELMPATAYHVRLVVATSLGQTVGEDVSFTTKAPRPAQAAPAAPQLAETVVVAPGAGKARVRKPGSDSFRALGAAASIPVGSVVDARDGSIVLNAARDAAGRMQRGRFGGSRFKIRQREGAGGYVDLHLRGGGLNRCGTTRSPLARAASTAPKRRLWGRDRNSRFRTYGRDSVATVRGTRWSVTDRCGGTVTRVTEGAVDVKVRRTGKVVRVNAGESHFARHRR